jgi:hypothetical protein
MAPLVFLSIQSMPDFELAAARPGEYLPDTLATTTDKKGP